MKMLKFNIIISNILFFLFPFLMVSCEEDKLVNDTPDRLFRPILEAEVYEENAVRLVWVPIKNASYSLEISRDSLLFENNLQVFLLDEVLVYRIENLWSNSRYSARIKAVSKDSAIKDSEYNQVTFKTGTENIFYTVATGDISTNQVLLKWNSAKDVSQIVVSATGFADVIVTLSAADKLVGQKLIQGLTANTSYTFKIYLEVMLRGTTTAITKAS